MKRTKLKKINWIPVVAGFLKKDQKILVGQRPENHSLAGLWEFPGGKIEIGETPEQALQRELNEELGIEAQIGTLRLACTHSYGDVGIIILFYEVNYWKGEPKAKHHLMLEWIYPQELKTRPIPEANKKILNDLFKALGI
ncbi:MAG: 8-oxo-dGTP diphosphatase MutT [Bdellovibrionaceae bacterium]|nr:8-oxo-dGTP diphosphatase MutT [Pseudobdellovibrionaceae bacterium]